MPNMPLHRQTCRCTGVADAGGHRWVPAHESFVCLFVCLLKSVGIRLREGLRLSPQQCSTVGPLVAVKHLAHAQEPA